MTSRDYDLFLWSYGLGAVAVTLRLCGCVSWPWWLATLPFWWLPVFVVGAGVACVVLACGVRVVRWVKGNAREF